MDVGTSFIATNRGGGRIIICWRRQYVEDTHS